MVPWSALPWDIIILIILLSLIIPLVLALVFIKIKRYEDLGIAIGIFLIILGTISYGYIIPQEIVQKAMLPEDYIWSDEGQINYWERNNLFALDKYQFRVPLILTRFASNRQPIERNFIGKEVIHAVDYDPKTQTLLIHDVIYDDTGTVFSVINGKEKVSEWYWVNPYISDLTYANVNAGHMGIPAHPGAISTLHVGWVESNGQRDGKENVVLVRSMHKLEEGVIEGVKVSVWQSDVFNKPVIWHGEPYIVDETLRLTVHDETGYVVHVYRHLVFSARLSQFLKIYYPESLASPLVRNYLKLNDPYGEAAELLYQTTPESQSRHLAAVRAINIPLTYLPLLICIPMYILGILLLWRYSGRSYYWKRYKKYDKTNLFSEQIRSIRRSSPRSPIALIVGICIILSSIGVLYLQTLSTPEISPRVSEDDTKRYKTYDTEQPTPPGTERGIDSGRHVLTPADEGPHPLSRREWWYYNVIFDAPHSELQNYSLIVSFNKMAFDDIMFLKRDNLFIVLYDDQDTYYDFSIISKPRRTLQMTGPGVNLKFEGSWAKGQYPSWQIYAVNQAEGFVADLVFSADFMPVWVMGRSSNLLFAGHSSGNYYIPRCFVEGTIRWNGKEYTVAGTGYHDHIWETVVPRFVTTGWDWMNLHFDNGWEMYFSKFMLRSVRKDQYAGAIVISPNTRDIIEFNIFTVTYVETRPSETIARMEYPTKLRITAHRDGISLLLDVDITNMCELSWRLSRTAMFEGPCRATGSLSWDGNTVNLQGYGMSEFTRVKYLVRLPRLRTQ